MSSQYPVERVPIDLIRRARGISWHLGKGSSYRPSATPRRRLQPIDHSPSRPLASSRVIKTGRKVYPLCQCFFRLSPLLLIHSLHSNSLATHHLNNTMAHDHSGPAHGHAHDAPGGDHGHTHEVLNGPGSYMGREMPIIEGRNWNERAFTVGIGG